MSKADEKSKQYRDFREQCGIKDPVMLDEIEEAYYEGYQQAEKDLELTYDDICEIMEIREDVLEMDSYENLYEEILKRFKDYKERKEK